MDEEVYELHARVCQALSHPIRLKVLDLLRSEERSVKELVGMTGSSQPNLSLHLKVLLDVGILSRRQEGATALYRVSHPEVFEAIDILRRILAKRIAHERQLTQRTVIR
jgi:ArsR family transcriptional regulator